MELILIKDVEKLGFADDLVNVRPGFGLNYLIPQGFAVVKSEGNLSQLSGRLKAREKQEAKLLSQFNEISARLSSATIKIGAKVGTLRAKFLVACRLSISPRLLRTNCRLKLTAVK